MSLKDAELTASSIDQNVLVGGSTRIPAVQTLMENLLGKTPNQTVNPDEGCCCWRCCTSWGSWWRR